MQDLYVLLSVVLFDFSIILTVVAALYSKASYLSLLIRFALLYQMLTAGYNDAF